MTVKTYRIGEVSRLLELESYVLRFWETEFSQLVPLRTEKGQRVYTEEHITLLNRIKSLLYDQGMTIEGARKVLSSTESNDQGVDNIEHSALMHMQYEDVLEVVRHELLLIRALLERSSR